MRGHHPGGRRVVGIEEERVEKESPVRILGRTTRPRSSAPVDDRIGLEDRGTRKPMPETDGHRTSGGEETSRSEFDDGEGDEKEEEDQENNPTRAESE